MDSGLWKVARPPQTAVREFRLPLKVLRNLYTCITESILCRGTKGSMDHQNHLPQPTKHLQDIWTTRLDLGHSIFSLLPSGQHYNCTPST